MSFCDTERGMAALEKYKNRGWAIVERSHSINDLRGLVHSFCSQNLRFINDSSSWILPLDMIGVGGPEALISSSPRLTLDPVIHNSWRLDHPSWYCLPTYHPKVSSSWGWLPLSYEVSSPMLKHKYLVGDPLLCELLVDHFQRREWEALEQKMKSLSIGENEQAVTWCVWPPLFGCR